MFSVGGTVVLSDDKKYLVSGRATVNGRTYYCLFCNDDITNVKICYEKIENEKVYMKLVENNETIKKLLPLFKNSIKKFLKNGSN